MASHHGLWRPTHALHTPRPAHGFRSNQNDAAPTLVLAQLCNFVVRSTQFEAADGLQTFCLYKHVSRRVRNL